MDGTDGVAWQTSIPHAKTGHLHAQRTRPPLIEEGRELSSISGNSTDMVFRLLRPKGPALNQVPGEEPQRAVQLEGRELAVLAGVGVQRLLG